MVVDKAVNPGGIKHNKPEANAQLRVINGGIISNLIKNPRSHLTGSNQPPTNHLFDYPVHC